MVKGNRILVHDLISFVKGTFEEKSKNYIDKYGVYGTTLVRPLYNGDTRDRFFHIYYNPYKAAHEKRKIHEQVITLEKSLKKLIGKTVKVEKKYSKYFSLTFDGDGNLESYTRNEEAIDDEILHAGYFVIISTKNSSEWIKVIWEIAL